MAKVRPLQEREMVRINDTLIRSDEFAWDGCHKLYVVTDQEARDQLEGYGYDFFPIDELKDCWDRSCGLRFISDASLSCDYVSQSFEGTTRITVI